MFDQTACMECIKLLNVTNIEHPLPALVVTIPATPKVGSSWPAERRQRRSSDSASAKSARIRQRFDRRLGKVRRSTHAWNNENHPACRIASPSIVDKSKTDVCCRRETTRRDSQPIPVTSPPQVTSLEFEASASESQPATSTNDAHHFAGIVPTPEKSCGVQIVDLTPVSAASWGPPGMAPPTSRPAPHTTNSPARTDSHTLIHSPRPLRHQSSHRVRLLSIRQRQQSNHRQRGRERIRLDRH